MWCGQVPSLICSYSFLGVYRLICKKPKGPGKDESATANLVHLWRHFSTLACYLWRQNDEICFYFNACQYRVLWKTNEQLSLGLPPTLTSARLSSCGCVTMLHPPQHTLCPAPVGRMSWHFDSCHQCCNVCDCLHAHVNCMCVCSCNLLCAHVFCHQVCVCNV